MVANNSIVETHSKAQTFKLMDQRSAIETEIDAIIHRLSLPGCPGLDGTLVDSEGFPRSDIDVHAVRADRHRLAELKNDHKAITEKINQNIQLLHAEANSKSEAISTSEYCMEVDRVVSSMPNTCIGDIAERDAIASIPFALVDEITESSPAAEDGLQLGDQIVKFGSVESGENMLPMLAQEMQRNQGSAISVTIMRHGSLSSLSVTPRAWQGRGLLGCHFKLL